MEPDEILDALRDLSCVVEHTADESEKTGTIFLEEFPGGPTEVSDALERMTELFRRLDSIMRDPTLCGPFDWSRRR
jgi:hypothetical protein